MENIQIFLTNLNKITKETGVIIDSFGESFYDPTLCTEDEFGTYCKEEPVYLSYDIIGKTYVARTGNPYDGLVIFPKGYEESSEN